MGRSRFWALLLAAAALIAPFGSTAWPQAGDAAASATQDCAALARFNDAGVTVNIAELVTTPATSGPARAPYCRVEGLIEGRIGFELWLPAANRWNGRMLGAGTGGDAGYYNLADLGRGVGAGYAAITSDAGHKRSEADWMMREDAVLDYTHRAQHLTNVAGRALIAAYYGRGPHHAYFIGCSGGGRQALKEMQLFPNDYDGIVAGAAGPNMPEMSARHLWHALYQQQNPDGAMSDAAWNIVSEAVLAACDRDDGLADRIVANPARCRFDPGNIECRNGQSDNCLSSAQVQTVRAFYAPLRDENGRRIDRGLYPGVRTRPGPPSPLLLPFFAHGAHRDSSWTPERFNIAGDLALAHERMPEMRADDPDLRAFAARGGRAILYQGWLDPSIPAQQSIGYYERVRREMGPRATEEIMRLYLAPGVLHCAGGEGPDRFGGMSAGFGATTPIADQRHDLLSALVAWVEDGAAPEEIIASRLREGRIDMQRPLCPYPQQARYIGGDPNVATSFRCRR